VRLTSSDIATATQNHRSSDRSPSAADIRLRLDLRKIFVADEVGGDQRVGRLDRTEARADPQEAAYFIIDRVGSRSQSGCGPHASIMRYTLAGESNKSVSRSPR
jgi:hypothetical protein